MCATLADRSDFCHALARVGQRNGHRYLVIWSGEQGWCQQQWQSLQQGFPQRCALLGGEHPGGGGFLGQEFELALIDGWQRHRVNDWLALAGTLVAGGVLHLFVPPLAEWPGVFRGPGAVGTASPFIHRLLGLIEAAPGVYVLAQGGGLPALPEPVAQPWCPALPSPDQQRVVADIVRVAKGRKHRPLVLTADRGRGKSAALGIAAAHIQQQRPGARVLLVAGLQASVAIARRHYRKALGDAGLIDAGDAGFRHLPPDAALDSPAQWDLVLVDEAASLPVSVLTQLTNRFPRLVFASTVRGYEGSGRGFELRFAKTLQAMRPQSRRTHLTVPLRWAADDPLEAFLNRAFVMASVDDPGLASAEEGDEAGVALGWLNPQHLAGDEALLNAVFTLLLQAHYQTTPGDLQALLDSPLPLLVAWQDGQVVGVCQCLAEGGLADELTSQVIAGRRQPSGSLAAQRLARQSGNGALLVEHSWRVQRVAVAEAWRRRGLGRAMLRAVIQRAQAQGQAYVSASFALDAPVLAFWQGAGFQPCYLGSRRDGSSGSYSLIVAQPLAGLSRPGIVALGEQLAADLFDCVALVQRQLDAASVAALMATLPGPQPGRGDQWLLGRYLAGELSFESCAAGLRRLLRSLDLRAMAPGQQRVLLGRLLWGKSWGRLAEEESLAGRREVEAIFRAAWQRTSRTLQPSGSGGKNALPGVGGQK